MTTHFGRYETVLALHLSVFPTPTSFWKCVCRHDAHPVFPCLLCSFQSCHQTFITHMCLDTNSTLSIDEVILTMYLPPYSPPLSSVLFFGMLRQKDGPLMCALGAASDAMMDFGPKIDNNRYQCASKMEFTDYLTTDIMLLIWSFSSNRKVNFFFPDLQTSHGW